MLGYGTPVRCTCGWDDNGELIVTEDPRNRKTALGISGDEGYRHDQCPECDEPLTPLTVEARETGRQS